MLPLKPAKTMKVEDERGTKTGEEDKPKKECEARCVALEFDDGCDVLRVRGTENTGVRMVGGCPRVTSNAQGYAKRYRRSRVKYEVDIGLPRHGIRGIDYSGHRRVTVLTM